MMLLTKVNRAQLPALYSQDNLGEEAIVYVKFFTPDANWIWYCTEFSPEDGIFFGLVDGLEVELGYFSLAELKEIRGRFGLGIERDRHWQPRTLAKCREEIRQRRGY